MEDVLRRAPLGPVLREEPCLETAGIGNVNYQQSPWLQNSVNLTQNCYRIIHMLQRMVEQNNIKECVLVLCLKQVPQSYIQPMLLTRILYSQLTEIHAMSIPALLRKHAQHLPGTATDIKK